MAYSASKDVLADEINAAFKNGILEARLPGLKRLGLKRSKLKWNEPSAGIGRGAEIAGDNTTVGIPSPGILLV